MRCAVIFVFRRKTEPKCNGFCEAKIGEESSGLKLKSGGWRAFSILVVFNG